MAYCPAESSLGQAGLRSAELSARGVEDSRGVSSGLADGYAWAAPPTAHRTTEPWRTPGAASRERWRDSPRRLSVKITTARLAKTTCKPVLKRAGEGPEDPLAAQHRRYSFDRFPAARRRRASSFRLAPPKQPKSEGATRPEASKSGQEVAPQVSGPRSTPSPIRGRYTKKSTLRADARSARDTRKATLRDARSAKDAERRLPTTV